MDILVTGWVLLAVPVSVLQWRERNREHPTPLTKKLTRGWIAVFVAIMAIWKVTG